ncbi:MAG: CotH kinase family protein [Acidimicrobiales bacterium]
MAVYVAGLVALVGLFGSARVVAVTSSDRTANEQPNDKNNINGTVDLWDADVLHTIEVRFDSADYTRMLAAFRADGSKTYIEADITIDGTKIESVGLRLKGNSTLRSLLGGGGGIGGAPVGGGQLGGGQLGGGQVPPGGGQARPPGASIPQQQQQGGAVPGGPIGGGTTTTVSTDQPEKLPWLIQFDEFVKNRRYQGQKEIAVRPSAGVTPTTALNEVLSLQLIAMAGEPSERSAYSSFAVNGTKPTLRLVLEQPGDEFAGDNFDDEGVLYKSLSTGRFQYLGEDPLAYSNAYRQITQKNEHDLAPVIKLLKWVTDASDAEFEADLDKHVDVASLARYVALHNLLLDFDDMSGPGQNSYLWYNLETKLFTIISWDVNLSLSGTLTQGPLDAGGFGGAGARIGGTAVPGGGAIPPGGGGAIPGGLGGNLLKTRFLASAKFQQVYLQEYRKIYDDLMVGGRALTALANVEKFLTSKATSLIDTATITADAQRLRQTLTGRTEGLKGKL